MQLGEFIRLFEGMDPEMEVKVRVSILPGDDEFDATDMTLDEFEGEYCEISDERSVLVENNGVTVIADYTP